MTHKQQAVRDRVIAEAMADLIRDQRFEQFINLLRAQREAVQFDLCSDAVVKSDRLTCTAIGELRCFNSIIAAYDEARDREIGAEIV